jgi:hypothetical protein
VNQSVCKGMHAVAVQPPPSHAAAVSQQWTTYSWAGMEMQLVVCLPVVKRLCGSSSELMAESSSCSHDSDKSWGGKGSCMRGGPGPEQNMWCDGLEGSPVCVETLKR